MRLLLCATAMVLASSLGAQGVRISMKAWREPVLLDSMRQDHEIKAPPEKVYDAVHKAFADLGIPVGRTESGIVGSERFEKMHNLAGAPLSRAFNCGEGALGPFADAWRLEIAFVAWVRPSPKGGTTLSLATIASASDVSGAYRVPKECGSLGSLETKFVDRVNKRLGLD